MPPTSCRFLPGIPLDPPRAGIKASAGAWTAIEEDWACPVLPDDQARCCATRCAGPGNAGASNPSWLVGASSIVPGRRRDVDALLAWGRRPSARRVERLGQHWGLPVWHIEDGFLRSLGKGRGNPPLALLIDDLGVHFDACLLYTSPSPRDGLLSRMPSSA